MTDDIFILPLRRLTFREEEPPRTSRHTRICLYCLCRHGRIRWVTRESQYWLCRGHSRHFGEWRKKNGLPKAKRKKKRKKHALVAQGKQIRAQILDLLKRNGAMAPRHMAKALGFKTTEGLYHHLKILRDAGAITKTGRTWGTRWHINTDNHSTRNQRKDTHHGD